ncbi:hypothetical protein A2160_00135 [Candidatus Beckwithbacteria bacterium RBG_13_42_9]|uniref:ABC transporter permease n=1 Tax=Candidatus Beckwithbacteria bacterium RBG_13_42_9 TaxID=1797457 RepID=A0A1F5E573_9BACT|nr:MAG: hypothetical protein A2160_00135 [Candidatus Beckwithbacteria bacterium RBG_13_42_9]
MRQFLALFSISLKDAFVYRVRSFIWFLNDVLPVLTAMLFFGAVFSQQKQVGDYVLSSILSYYLVTLSLNVLLEPHPEFAIYLDINSGFLSTYLLKPLSYIRFYIASEIAWKTIRLTYLTPFMILALIALHGCTTMNLMVWWRWLIFGLMLAVSFMIFYFWKVIIGFMAFWFNEITWLLGISELLSTFFSGIIFPLDLMPKYMQQIASLLPFKYVIYIPAKLLTSVISLEEQFKYLIIQLVWLSILGLVVKRLWRKGVKDYEAYGN